MPSLINYETRRKALCDLIDTNMAILEALKAQFAAPQTNEQDKDQKLYKLEGQNAAFQESLAVLGDFLQGQSSGLRTRLTEIHQTRLQISTPLCFINKLPSEVLHDILLEASQYYGQIMNANSVNINYAPYFALQLTHVCRYWRILAINSPAIWETIVLSPGAVHCARKKGFWETISIYTQNTPVQIIISDSEIPRKLMEHNPALWSVYSPEELIYESSVRESFYDLKSYDLHGLKHVKSIVINVCSEPNLERLLDTHYDNLACCCDELKVLGSGDGISQFVLNLSTLLHHFDAKVVKCEDTEIVVSSERFVQGRALKEIHLSNINDIPLDLILEEFQEITVLCCTQSILEWNTEQMLAHSRLQKLKLEDRLSTDCRWLDYLHSPALNDLDTPNWASDEAFIGLLARLPKLRRINLGKSDDRRLLQLMEHLPRITNLVVSSDALTLLYDWTSYGLSKVPFPMLESLEIVAFDGKTRTLLPTIQARCFPPVLSPKEFSAHISTISVQVIGGRDDIESSLSDSDLFNLMDVKWEGQALTLTVQNARRRYM